MQTGTALAAYIALMGAVLAGFSPLVFALYSAIVLGLWLSLYSFASISPPTSHPGHPSGLVVPSLSESMAELHSLQSEINVLQAQFSSQTKMRPIAPDDASD